MSEPSREVVEVFFAIADIMENISQKSIASYVISMTRQASHVMEVHSSYLFFE
jgi:phosphoenolpyruvate carboxylase